MSFQQMTIAPETMADLYKGHLVIMDDKQSKGTLLKQKNTISDEKEQPLRFLGNNNKKVGILVHFTDETFLPDLHLQFLIRILEACKMNLGDVAILNLATQPITMNALKPIWQPAFILQFGISPDSIGLPIHFPDFKAQVYDGVTYLSFPPMEQLNRDTENGKLLKSKLWVCLKNLFHL